ncbi:DUF3159 domain-containing protein [Nocardia sp. NPDC004722]
MATGVLVETGKHRRDTVEDQRSGAAEMWGKFLALDGPKHLLDGAAPAIGFLVGYGSADAEVGVLVALTIAVGLGLYRMLKGETVRTVALSVAAVAVFSLFVGITGEGRGFYLPDLIVCAIGAVAFGVPLVTGRPLSHWICRRIGLEPAAHADPEQRIRLHRKVSVAWFAFWMLHLVIMVPLYVADKVVILGTVALILGKPLLVVAIAATFLYVRRSLKTSSAK